MNRGKALLLCLVITALPLAAGPVGADVSRTPVQALEYTCVKSPGEIWQSGNVLHVRGQLNENVVVAGDAIWGINTAVLNYNLNLHTGQIVGNASADFVPLGASGGYAGTGEFRFEDFGMTTAFGMGNLQGYGEFKGQLMRQDLAALPPDPLAGSAYCEGHGEYFSTTQWDGYFQYQE